MKKIMIIEDDIMIREELTSLLTNSMYEVVALENFEHVVEDILKNKVDLVLLDINLPGLNGEIVLSNLRKRSNIPVIMVTSRNTEADEILSMSYGADDYITKPYQVNILLLRIAAVLKRCDSYSDTPTYKDLDINLQKGVIKRGEQEVILTKNETIIFSYLLGHQNRVVSRDELMTDLWDNQEYINDNALTVNISRLRAKLTSVGYPDAIETRKKVGYILS